MTKKKKFDIPNALKDYDIPLPKAKSRVPRVDDGIKGNDYENLEDFYRRSHVHEYVQVLKGGKLLKFEFGKLVDAYRAGGGDDEEDNPVLRALSTIDINKKSFVNNMNVTVRYINYFIQYFDDDDELLNAYFHFMFMIMNKGIDMPPEDFIDNLHTFFGTDSMIRKVIAMVEWNTDESVMKKPDKSYDESIQLTTDHLKAIMGASCLHKFVIPIVTHYYTRKKKLLEEAKITEKELYYYAFSGFTGSFDEYYDISMFDKLYHTITTRVSKTEGRESKMWNRRNRVGVTATSYTNNLMRDFLIDISQKVAFSKSAIAFIHVCFDRAIKNELIQPDKFEFTDMEMSGSDSVNEKVSRWDKWQAEKASFSQLIQLRGYVSIKDFIEREGKRYDLDFKHMDSKKDKHRKATRDLREEFEYYRKNLPQPLNDTQMYLITLYCAAKLNSFDDTKLMDTKDIYKIIMIMKRDLTSRNYTYLQHFISGIVNASRIDRKYNKRKVEKLFVSHPCYEDWDDQYEFAKELLNTERIFMHLKTILASPITVVDFHFDEGTLNPVDVSVVDEYMRFLMEL